MKQPRVKRKRERKREPLEILQPGERSPFFDKILAMRTSRPASFRLLSPGVRLSAGVYEAGLRRAAEVEAMKREPVVTVTPRPRKSFWSKP